MLFNKYNLLKKHKTNTFEQSYFLGETLAKADLEELVSVQLENLNAMHDLLSIMEVRNELLHNVNKKLRDEISEFTEIHFAYPADRRNRK